MAKIVKRRRGTTADHDAFIGANGELTVDLTKDTVVVHDEVTPGGFPLAREDMSNVTNRIGITQLNFPDGINGQFLKTNGAGGLTFDTIDVSASPIGGDLSGTVANAQIGGNTVGIAELDIDGGDGTNGQVLTTNGSGVLQFTSETNVSTSSVGGDISGTIGNAQIVAGAVGTIEIADGSVTATKYANLSIATEKISDSQITTIKIADSAVTDVKISGMTSNKLNGDLPALVGRALTNLPYDIGFIAGFDKDLLKEDVEVATYGEIVMARTGTFIGESGFSDTAPTGSAMILDIEKNGTTIYSTKPQFGAGSQTLTAGILGSGNFVAGDRITFKITQRGSGTKGQGVRLTMRGEV